MQIHQLKREHRNKKSKIIGRGGKRGKTSGRGTKGQKARAGRKIRPEMRDIIKKIPKRRGYRFKSLKAKPLAVNLSVLEKTFSAEDKVSPRNLFEKGILKGQMTGRKVKLLSSGVITKKLLVSGFLVSKEARAKIDR
ncbi:MAG: 50S ribosomal protein L15, partial [Parcubacteria group bacterium Gr01-1014_107]